MASFQVELAPFALHHQPTPAESWVDDFTDLWVHQPQWKSSPNTDKCSINEDKWRRAAEVPNSRGVSSLVQKWKGLEAEGKCNCKNEEELFGDWESDRTAASGPPSSRGCESDRTAESDRVRVADIIKKLTPSGEIGAATEQKCLLSPRVRGRQAYNNLLIQMERDRRQELQGLAACKPVSNFSHRARIRDFLRQRVSCSTRSQAKEKSCQQPQVTESRAQETASNCNDDSWEESDKGWIVEVSRPRSDWEGMRQARYQEMLNPFSENEEIRLLLRRRSVSNFLSSDLREIIDRVMIIRSQGQESVKQDPVAKEEEQEGDYGEYFDEYEEQCDDFMGNNNITSSPATYSYQVSPTSANFYSRNNASSSIEMELICDLRRHLEQLHQEMSDMRKSIKFCVDMQMSMKKEMAVALNRDTKKKIESRGGKCCVVCQELQIDCVLYRCGHMCTCYKCGQELQSTTGRCPLCIAPIIDVVRTYSNYCS